MLDWLEMHGVVFSQYFRYFFCDIVVPQYIVTSAILVSSRSVSRYLPRYRSYHNSARQCRVVYTDEDETHKKCLIINLLRSVYEKCGQQITRQFLHNKHNSIFISCVTTITLNSCLIEWQISEFSYLLQALQLHRRWSGHPVVSEQWRIWKAVDCTDNTERLLLQQVHRLETDHTVCSCTRSVLRC